MRARPKSQILRSQFSLTRMLLGLRSRWTTPAECTYLRPRFAQISYCFAIQIEYSTYQNLVEEVLNKLFFEWP